MNVYEESLKLHEAHHGKLTVEPKVPCETAWDLSLAYTPGVAQPCLEIQKDPENAYRYTGKGNTVAVITDGTPASMPGRSAWTQRIRMRSSTS